MATVDEKATSFGQAADVYQSARPGYPAEAVAWMLERAPRGGHVVDVGAGTGKLTRAVVDAGYTVTAIDPDATMLAKLRAAIDEARTGTGTAEQLPLDDASADAVVLGQAWHWVDPPAASREIGRVLRAGGTLSLVWNIRDESEPWVADLTRVVGASAAETLIAGAGPVVTEPFGGLETRTWSWRRALTTAQLFDLAHSRSPYITAERATRARIDDALGELFAGLPELANGGTVSLPYTTHVFRAARA